MKLIFLLGIGILAVQQIWLNSLLAEDNSVLDSQIKIVINETNRVRQTPVFLGDISDITANDFLKETLEKIELGSSPKPGKIKLFYKKKIFSVIQGQTYLPDGISIVSPEKIYVKRLSQTISKQDIRQVIDHRLSLVFKDREYQIKSLTVRGLEPYPQGETQILPDSNDMVKNNGKLSFSLNVIIDGVKEDRLNISGKVAVYENILHAGKDLARGGIISREDVYLEKKNIFELGDHFVKSVEAIDGKVLKSGVRKGDCIRTVLLEDIPLIHKGDIVKLVAKNEDLLIVTSAISREDGFQNGLIRVENLNSGRLVRGIVKGRAKVEVVN